MRRRFCIHLARKFSHSIRKPAIPLLTRFALLKKDVLHPNLPLFLVLSHLSDIPLQCVPALLRFDQ